MIVLLPRKDLAPLEEKFTAGMLAAWVKRLRNDEVNVHLPKFKITCDLTLNEPLKKLGMNSAFSPGADFTGMSRRSNLYITAVVHKAFVDVNEKGTEAAAATGVVVGDEAMHEEIHFRADRPFLFVIRHETSGTILFVGRVADPRG
jgi:serpin B